jgi:integrase
MARKRISTPINLLSTKAVKAAGDGDHADGGGLVLRVQGEGASWVFRYTAPNGRRREMGLKVKLFRQSDALIGESITAARRLASEARELLTRDLDPLEERSAKRGAKRDAEAAKKAEVKRDNTTLARAARAYHERVIEPNRTDKHGKQWIASLENHIPEKMWNAPIHTITAPALLDLMAELQAKLPETASRVRQRLEAIFDDAEFRGINAGNPARAIRRKLTEVRGGRRDRGSFAALPYSEVPAFVTDLRAREGVAARALEFGLLTAARTGEVLGATAEEFDLQAAIWRVPGVRMKGGEDHAVFLTPRAVAIARAMIELQGAVVFTAQNRKKGLSNMAMLTVLRRMKVEDRTTVHGVCRASFSTWAYETAAARPDVIEACLAHREADRVKRAYNRALFNAERKALLQAWADFTDGIVPKSNVVEFSQKAAA